MIIGRGLYRDDDGVLVWGGGSHYCDPGEAVKTWYAGKTNITCNESVFSNYSSKPCGKPAKHDLDSNGNPTKCGIHCVSGKAKSKARADARYQAFREKTAIQAALSSAEKGLENVLQRIADGHNDPRTLAQETLAELNIIRDKVKP